MEYTGMDIAVYLHENSHGQKRQISPEVFQFDWFFKEHFRFG